MTAEGDVDDEEEVDEDKILAEEEEEDFLETFWRLVGDSLDLLGFVLLSKSRSSSESLSSL